MRRPRNFQTDRCYHLVSRVAHRAFYLNEEVRTRFVERMRRWAEIEPSFPAHVPRLLSRDLLAVLADKPKRPADLRRELGVSSPNYFTSCYLTPLAAAGFIVSEEACHSPQRTYRLTVNGRRVLT